LQGSCTIGEGEKNHRLPHRSAIRRQCSTCAIPFPDVSHIRDYEEGMEVQGPNIWAFQVQQVEQEWTIEEPKILTNGDLLEMFH
jgi:hypothetical protein